MTQQLRDAFLIQLRDEERPFVITRFRLRPLTGRLSGIMVGGSVRSEFWTLAQVVRCELFEGSLAEAIELNAAHDNTNGSGSGDPASPTPRADSDRIVPGRRYVVTFPTGASVDARVDAWIRADELVQVTDSTGTPLLVNARRAFFRAAA